MSSSDVLNKWDRVGSMPVSYGDVESGSASMLSGQTSSVRGVGAVVKKVKMFRALILFLLVAAVLQVMLLSYFMHAYDDPEPDHFLVLKNASSFAHVDTQEFAFDFHTDAEMSEHQHYIIFKDSAAGSDVTDSTTIHRYNGSGAISVLLLPDRPLWAFDFKADAIAGCLDDKYDFKKRFMREDFTESMNQASIVVTFWWPILVRERLGLIYSFRQNKFKVAVGICSHTSIEDENFEPAVAAMNRLSRGVFVHNLILYHQLLPVLEVPLYYCPNGVNTTLFVPNPALYEQMHPQDHLDLQTEAPDADGENDGEVERIRKTPRFPEEVWDTLSGATAEEKPSPSSQATPQPNVRLYVGWSGSSSTRSDRRGKEGKGELKGVWSFIVPAVRRTGGVAYLAADRHTGFIDHSDMAHFYPRLDAYVVASSSEGTPNPALEGGAAGVPLLTTRVGNMPQIVHSGMNGYFITRSIKDIHKKMMLLRDDPWRRTQMSRMIHHELQEWDWCDLTNNFDRMFQSMAKYPYSLDDEAKSKEKDLSVHLESAQLPELYVGPGSISRHLELKNSYDDDAGHIMDELSTSEDGGRNTLSQSINSMINSYDMLIVNMDYGWHHLDILMHDTNPDQKVYFTSSNLVLFEATKALFDTIRVCESREQFLSLLYMTPVLLPSSSDSSSSTQRPALTVQKEFEIEFQKLNDRTKAVSRASAMAEFCRRMEPAFLTSDLSPDTEEGAHHMEAFMYLEERMYPTNRRRLHALSKIVKLGWRLYNDISQRASRGEKFTEAEIKSAKFYINSFLRPCSGPLPDSVSPEISIEVESVEEQTRIEGNKTITSTVKTLRTETLKLPEHSIGYNNMGWLGSDERYAAVRARLTVKETPTRMNRTSMHVHTDTESGASVTTYTPNPNTVAIYWNMTYDDPTWFVHPNVFARDYQSLQRIGVMLGPSKRMFESSSQWSTYLHRLQHSLDREKMPVELVVMSNDRWPSTVEFDPFVKLVKSPVETAKSPPTSTETDELTHASNCLETFLGISRVLYSSFVYGDVAIAHTSGDGTRMFGGSLPETCGDYVPLEDVTLASLQRDRARTDRKDNDFSLMRSVKFLYIQARLGVQDVFREAGFSRFPWPAPKVPFHVLVLSEIFVGSVRARTFNSDEWLVETVSTSTCIRVLQKWWDLYQHAVQYAMRVIVMDDMRLFTHCIEGALKDTIKQITADGGTVTEKSLRACAGCHRVVQNIVSCGFQSGTLQGLVADWVHHGIEDDINYTLEGSVDNVVAGRHRKWDGESIRTWVGKLLETVDTKLLDNPDGYFVLQTSQLRVYPYEDGRRHLLFAVIDRSIGFA